MCPLGDAQSELGGQQFVFLDRLLLVLLQVLLLMLLRVWLVRLMGVVPLGCVIISWLRQGLPVTLTCLQ